MARDPAARGPKPRLVPLINGADRNLRWFIGDVWGQFGDDHERPGAALFRSERKNRDGSCARATDDVFRRSLAKAASRHLPARSGKLTPHVLRHFCASQLYQAGMTLFAIQELSWSPATAPLPRVPRWRPASPPIMPTSTPCGEDRTRSTRAWGRTGSPSTSRTWSRPDGGRVL
jgi:Phage integrase family